MSTETSEITPLLESEIRESARCWGTTNQRGCKRSAEFFVKVKPHDCGEDWGYEYWTYLVCQRHCAELLDRKHQFGCNSCGTYVTLDNYLLDWGRL